MTTKGHLPAFPEVQDEPQFSHHTYGLTKREYFAAMAMQGVVTAWSEGGIPWHETNFGLIADRATEMADALIASLNEEKK